MISEKGTIGGNGSIRLLLGVHQLKHTGILYMKKEEVLKVLYFSRGRLLWAISNAGEDQLETVLIRHGIVNAEDLRVVKDGLPVNESIGKRLVEMNILTLDDLVRYTRIQLQQIVFSILSWQQGGYQFVKDSPPQRLLSLDLDLTELVAAFILKKIEMNRIWDEIGSFQVVLVPVENSERLEATGLTTSQEKLLRVFDGHKNLQTIVSRYAEEHRDSLLKVVFYLMCADLLAVKKEDLSDPKMVDETFDTVGLLFKEEDDKKTFKESEPVRFSSSTRDIALIESESPSSSREITVVDDTPRSPLIKPSMFNVEVPASAAELPAVENDVSEENRETGDDLTESLFPKEGKKNKRLSNWVYLMLLGIFIVGGTVLLMIIRGEEAQKLPPSKPFGAVVEKPQAETDNGNNVDKKEAEDITSPIKEEPIPPKDQVGNVVEGKKEPEAVSEPVLVPMQEVKKETDPWDLLHSGRLEEAGKIWSNQMKRQGVKFSVLLELDCQVESVLHAVDQFPDLSGFFILNRRRGERNCYLVMWGYFADEASALAAAKVVPDYFLRQENPPKVIALEPYL